MKQLLLIAVLLVTIMAGCKKNDTPYKNSITFDGKEYPVDRASFSTYAPNKQNKFSLRTLEGGNVYITIPESMMNKEFAVPYVSGPNSRWEIEYKNYYGNGESEFLFQKIKSGKLFAKVINATEGVYEVKFTVGFTDGKVLTGEYKGKFIL